MSTSSSGYFAKIGDTCYTRMDKINAEVFALTYGALVAQLVKDYEDVDKTTTLEQVNEKLEQMGYNIGLRLIDDFLAKSGLARCGSFKETAEAVSRVGFKMFLNLTPVVKDWNEKGSSCSLEFTDNPLEMFVELPDSCAGLKYSNMLCGVLRGALESVSLNVESTVISDALQGDTKTVLSLSLKNVIEDAANEDYRDD